MKPEITCLGIESTAHTLGIGVVSSQGKILANVKTSYRGEGIHPRKAAENHLLNLKILLQKALQVSKKGIEDIDLIAFSQGPGLPPCLRIGAIAARTLASNLKKPLVGVNHAVAHIEIGKLTTGAVDPLIVYVSGGNTQIIACSERKYKVFGETLDVALGNAIDSLGRILGLEFPAGPKIDELAEKGKWIDLPYVVKGMDFSFSGLLTEAERKIKNGEKVHDVCFSFEHNCFAMVTEASERALAYTKKEELLLTGGVASARRLQKMLKEMCEAREISFFVPKREYCVDNGAMIAWTGILKYLFSGGITLDKSRIKQKWRVDQVEIKWSNERETQLKKKKGEIIDVGAEAVIYRTKWLGLEAIKKVRLKKDYRDSALDAKLRKARTREEAILLHKAKLLGIHTPTIYDVDLRRCTLTMEYLEGPPLSKVLEQLNRTARAKVSKKLGEYVAKLHSKGLIHGDLTTSNVILQNGTIFMIDFGLGKHSNNIEDFSTDLFVLKKSLENNHWKISEETFKEIMGSYKKSFKKGDKVIFGMEKIWRRGRYQKRTK